MNDTDALNFIQTNGSSFSEDFDGRVIFGWLDKEGVEHKTKGATLRDCIIGAVIELVKLNSGLRRID